MESTQEALLVSYRTLRSFVGAARHRLCIKVPQWDASPQAGTLLDDTIAAHRRHVDVIVFTRPEASNDAAVRRLRDVGVRVVTVRNLHEKVVLADDRVLNPSTNFTRTALATDENSGTVHSASRLVDAFVAGFDLMRDGQDRVTDGEETWTPTADLIPPPLRPYLDRFDQLNPLQSKSVPAVLNTSGHVMVVAPTSSGKTLIGEVAALRSILLENRPAVWLLPARALAAEVAATAARWREHGIASIELTGETNMSSDRIRTAQLWVATTEKFESLYRRSSLRSFLDSVGCLIVDEVHLVGDHERGATLESLLARLRASADRTRIVALSATAGNAEELAAWFNAQLITVEWRPTRLITQFAAYDSPSGKPWADEDAKDEALTDLVHELSEDDAGTSGSVLIFCGSKNAVRRTAGQLAGVRYRGVDDDTLVEQAFAKGVGIHFRDAPKAQRALAAFNARQIDTLVATSGLSTGVNTPARTVIIRDLTLGINELETSQAQQMLGRAGRAGHEAEGFGFIMVPHSEELAWRSRLVAGYRVDSRLNDKLADAVLAEILLGSITRRADAQLWYEGTFAYAQNSKRRDLKGVLDHLVTHRLVTDADDTLTVTDLGALTTRLMVGVDAASNLHSRLAALPTPTDATEAEQLILAAIANSVPALRDWPVNPKPYGQWVDDTLATAPTLNRRLDIEFGSQFCAAAAVAALNSPDRLRVSGAMSRSELIRAIDALPRYLGWIAALGHIGIGSWQPVVAGDLARRLTWWHLTPHPQRGSGRLLWFLEQLQDDDARRKRVPLLWHRARSADFTDPNGINSPPRGVELPRNDFDNLVGSRAHLALGPSDRTDLPLDASPPDSTLVVVGNDGAARATVRTHTVPRNVELPVPHTSRATVLAADVILFSRRGDVAYQNAVVDLPETGDVDASSALDDARELIARLSPPTSVVTSPGRRRGTAQGKRRLLLSDLLPQTIPEPQLLSIAEALSGDADDETRVINLRAGLEELLRIDASAADAPRPAAAVLKAGRATPREFECVLLALAATLDIEVGAAVTDHGHLVALVHIGGGWRTATPLDDGHVISKPLFPEKLPPITGSLDLIPAKPSAPARPLFGWLAEFTPGSGEPPTSARRSTTRTDIEHAGVAEDHTTRVAQRSE
ncbi:DEAD/DEAH box helicase [Gordonia tangerina]|uniref:DEAD/DEAH box helicase n=1 Tax=Gordonia tangerina TaxID=2911060 RepID=A0ABS9DLS9_9ACTN|nr:DEAD/DEAH box helicase [Gordonia tangerina]MCF3940182.1 DEAD/DEAH box helicase [Gordonia tangerina]